MTSPGKFLLAAAVLALTGYAVYEVATPGPLGRRVMACFNLAGNSPIVARVYGHPITRNQLDRAMREQLWLDGKPLEYLTPESRKTVRAAALDTLIDHELLRVKAGADAALFKVSDAEIDARMLTLSSRFESEDVMKTVMKSQGVHTMRDLRDRIAAHIQQEKYVESRVAPLVGVTDTEARKWYDENSKQLAVPERIRVRHVFLATLENPPEKAKALLEVALGNLTNKRKDFATLAREISEDASTQNNGGDLGWMTRDRLPSDFSIPVFVLALYHPTLVRTKLGWHLVEVTARKPAQPRSFDEARPEVVAALEAIKRHKATEEFCATLRKFESPQIEILPAREGE